MGVKKLQAYKPDSVVGYHLSVPTVTCRDQSAYPSASNEQFSNADLCGISACKVCPQIMLPLNAVSFYLTFSPFHFPIPLSPAIGGTERLGVRLFSVALSLPSSFVKLRTGSRLLTGALLFAVRTFLPDQSVGAIAWLVANSLCKRTNCKNNH